jgi:hypothetical protein
VARHVSVKGDGPLPEAHLGDEPYRPPTPVSQRGEDDARSVSFPDDEWFPEATRAGSPLPDGMDHRLTRRVSFPGNQPLPEVQAGDDPLRPPTPVPDESHLTHVPPNTAMFKPVDESPLGEPRQPVVVSFPSTQMMPEAFVGEKSYRPATPVPADVGNEEFSRTVSFPKDETFPESHGELQYRPPTPMGQEDRLLDPPHHHHHAHDRSSHVSFPADAQQGTAHVWESGAAFAPPSPVPGHKAGAANALWGDRGQEAALLAASALHARMLGAPSPTRAEAWRRAEAIVARPPRSAQSARREEEWRAMRSAT